MEREEAIKWLKGIQGCYKKKYFDLDLLNGLCVEAIDMAIEALQAEPTHGRLIDADALKEKIRKEVYRHDYIEHVYQIIDNAPTVQADRPHGEWIVEPFRNNWEFKCSICGWYEHHAYKDAQRHNFCPKCGADMRKENK